MVVLATGFPLGSSLIGRHPNRKFSPILDLNDGTVSDAARLYSGGAAGLPDVS
jgi:hypothetical protein